MKLLKVGLTLAVVLLAVNAQAATTTTTFQVTATVNSACTVSASDLAFGIYDPSAAANNNTSTVTVTCTKATAYDIGLDKGLYGASTLTRQMKHATLADLINYSLSSVVTQASNWGDVVGTDTVHVASATGAAEAHTVYGRIATGQYVTAGSYADTITVTVTY